ncbi:uncharacterized protein K444DRAFT_545347 [Hyaloscypha bicolor E]|uniref:DUF676 domain-containing protein n=1 Tax=Hyaloscypha bicolor E TaxID=1095630 RepID=A0A2J6SKF3_9HELO|nr:uncharacterized protein K444DRAFT_545347 [Hyaloscypha bicolor E]PMD51210.1 hypothetical protein K444DRAFT_545347 [Hyaloscypha bicolor E]
MSQKKRKQSRSEYSNIPLICEADKTSSIVFVHGLQGHPKNTWTSKSRSSNASTPKSTDNLEERLTFWPYHLLREDCKNVRILTWGYNSNVSEFFSGSANKGNILSYSRDLLGDLAGERRSCPTRPIIFVAHSLGGKYPLSRYMLLRASESEGERDKNIYLSTKAILFLGTPHGGGNFVDWGETARRIVSAIGFDTNHQNTRDLAIDSPMLEDCRERFLNLHNRRNFEICTFQEACGMKGTSLLGLNRKVVDGVSSEFPDTGRRFTINANHMEMCRYSSREDDGYRKVSRELRILCEEIEKSLKEEEALKHQERQ